MPGAQRSACHLPRLSGQAAAQPVEGGAVQPAAIAAPWLHFRFEERPGGPAGRPVYQRPAESRILGVGVREGVRDRFGEFFLSVKPSARSPGGGGQERTGMVQDRIIGSDGVGVCG
jgi:hypothetical protein